jgi:hypothetical protein
LDRSNSSLDRSKVVCWRIDEVGSIQTFFGSIQKALVKFWWSWIDPNLLWIDPKWTGQTDFWSNFAGTPRLRPNSEWGDSWTVGKLYESTFKPNWPHLHSICILREMSIFLSVGQIFSRLITLDFLFLCSGPSLNLPKLLESTSKLRRLSSTALRDLRYFRIQPGIIWSFGHTLLAPIFWNSSKTQLAQNQSYKGTKCTCVWLQRAR